MQRLTSVAVAGLLAAATVHTAVAQDLAIELQEVVTGLSSPIGIANAGDGNDRLFVVQQSGEIRIVSDGELLPTPFLDISALVSCCGERGLLGLAVHPNYAANGFFYVDYTDLAGDTVVARYEVSSGDPDEADPGSAQIVLTQPQPFSNHNGGNLAFGPDGYLYIGFGDGGSGGDPQDNAQDLQTWLGKILRVDVDGDAFPGDPQRNYAVPPDNPFVGEPGRDEIWAYGLRNPWRFSFDRATGDLWIGDVGQGTWEEIDFQPAASPGGENYGWDVLEGGLQPGAPGPNHPNCFENDPGGDGSCADYLSGGSALPVIEYNHSLGCSVTGGYRYRGQAEPELQGVYFYADFCSGRIWGATPHCAGILRPQQLLDAPFSITTFGEDEDGEIYVVERNGNQSKVHRIVAGADASASAAAGFGDASGSGFTPHGLVIDPGTASSHCNGILEPGEAVLAAPRWRNLDATPQALSATASDFSGPGTVDYMLDDPAADYGSVDPERTVSCLVTGDCYLMGLSIPAARPATDWDATFDEILDDGENTTKTWTLHIGDSFADVPRANPFYPAIETLLHSGVTGGCDESGYCPGDSNTRGQMPVFMLRASEGVDYTPPACADDGEIFDDVPFNNPFCPWIQELANRDIVAGCGNGNYCPGAPVTRAQMAIFLLKTLEGDGYEPPACDGIFTDVTCPSLFADWIEDLAARGITSGCGATEYCPADPVTRGQMAVFVTSTFGLTLYGP